MPKSNSFLPLNLRHFGVITRLLVWLLLCPCFAVAQVPVALSPVPKLQFFDASGRPLSFGCLFTYKSGTNTALQTYTDSTGTVLNADPVILDAGGFAGSGSSGVWLQAGQAYREQVKSSGGTNCSLGSTLYTIDGIGGGLTILTSIIAYSTTPLFPIAAQNQLFEITLTGNAVAQPLTAVGITPPAWVAWEITQDGAGGHTFTWPSNSVGGCTIGSAPNQVTTQLFIWNGTNATAVGPCVIGNGPAINTGAIVATGTINATLVISSNTGFSGPYFASSSANPAASGVLRLAKGDLICWRNNANSADVCLTFNGSDNLTWPNGFQAAHLPATADFTLNGGTPQTGMQGTDVHLHTAGTVVASSPNACIDANGGVTTVCTGFGPTFAPQRTTSIVNSSIPSSTSTLTIVYSIAVTFPAAPGTYRADVRWAAFGTNSNTCVGQAIDTTNNHTYAIGFEDSNGGGGFWGASSSEISGSTYAASATATFTLQVSCNGAETMTTTPALFSFSPIQSGYLAVTPVLSN